MTDLGINLIANLIWVILGLLVAYFAKPFWRRMREELRPPAEPDPRDRQPRARPSARAALTFPPGASLVDKLVSLEQQRDAAQAAALEARRHGVYDRTFDERCASIEAALCDMSFIAPGDLLDDRYRLIEDRGAGRVSTVWKAYDTSRDKVVAVKLLRYAHVQDESWVKRLQYTVRVMSELSATNVATVSEQVREIQVQGARKLVYYVLEYIEGEQLEVYAARHPEQKARLIDGILDLGRSLADAHTKGIVHRDLKPSNILVQADGRMKLVDFDSVLRLGDRQVTDLDVGTFGYSAPEVFDARSDPDMRADVFAMGRVVSYLYYGGDELPSVYEQSVYDLIDLLNCAPVVKECLEQATAVPPSRRYGTMKEFVQALGRAVADDRNDPLPFLSTVQREWSKISTLLRQSFYGTFMTMIVARPAFAALGLAHLSDVARVGAFHAIIGSLVWGTFISGAFILFLILFGRRTLHRRSKYVAAGVCCALGGLAGGLLVSVPSVYVTNETTLRCLGWLSAAGGSRLEQALFETRMMLSYPLTGLLTGLGTGLALYRGIEIALRFSPQGSGVLPVPSKRAVRAPLVGAGVLRNLLLSPAVHLALACPILLSVGIAGAFDPASPPAPFVTASCQGIEPNAFWRTVGEGIVHYCGAVGLVGGFFWRVPPTAAPTLPPEHRASVRGVAETT